MKDIMTSFAIITMADSYIMKYECNEVNYQRHFIILSINISNLVIDYLM